MIRNRFPALVALVCLASIGLGALAPAVGEDDAGKWSGRINHYLLLTPDQQTKIDPVIERYHGRIEEIRKDGSLSSQDKRAKIREQLAAMVSEIGPNLSDAQKRRLDDFIKVEGRRRTVLPDLGVEGHIFFPSGSVARSAFGNSPTSFGLALSGEGAELGDRNRVYGTVETFSVSAHSNDLFVLSPQIAYEHRVPITSEIFGYANASAGPAYIDYSFDDPNGNHYGAKRLGAEGQIELGARWGQLKAGVDYLGLTEPAGVNFSGFRIFLSWTAIRF